MRNPNRTTKRERRLIRRRNPTMSRILGIAEAARWHRHGILLDEARAFETMAADLLYGRPPIDLDDRTLAAINVPQAPQFAPMGHLVVDVEPTYTESIGHEFGPDGWVDIKYPMHVSLGAIPIPADQCRALAAALEAEFGPDREQGVWHDPNEAAAVHAEAIEHALNDDIDPGD